MANEVNRIQDQLQRSLAGNAWHGPALLELLADVNAAKAAAHPIQDAHSIWELVLHIATWNKVGVARLDGGPGEPSDEENFPAVTDVSEAAWARTLDYLKESFRELLAAIAAVDEARLDQPIVEGKSSIYVTLHGVIQHGLYHAGQIAILKKI